MTRLDGRVALITGTAGGQGAAAAALFASAGATVVGCDIAPTDGSEPVDLTDEDAVRRWVGAAASEHGGIDILYANAGATRFSPLEETSADEEGGQTVRGGTTKLTSFRNGKQELKHTAGVPLRAVAESHSSSRPRRDIALVTALYSESL